MIEQPYLTAQRLKRTQSDMMEAKFNCLIPLRDEVAETTSSH
jgi:hypothetical protein